MNSQNIYQGQVFFCLDSLAFAAAQLLNKNIFIHEISDASLRDGTGTYCFRNLYNLEGWIWISPMVRILVISTVLWFLILIFAQPIFFLLSFSNDFMDV